MLDLLICGLFVFGVAKLLNATIFNLNPASKMVAWILTVVMFFVLAGVLTVLFAWRSPGISHIAPGIALALAWMFYIFLNKKEIIKVNAKEQPKKYSDSLDQRNKINQKLISTSHMFPSQLQPVEKNIKCEGVDSDGLEEEIYNEIGHELEDGNVNLAMWTRSIAESNGDEPKTKAFYIKLRFKQLAKQRLIKDAVTPVEDEVVPQNQTTKKKYVYSEDELDSALNNAKLIHDPIYKVSELVRIAKEYMLIGKFKESNIVLDKALEESELISDFDEKGLSLAMIVSGYLSAGNIDSAYNSALSIEGDAIKASSFSEIADKYEKNGENDKAKKLRILCKMSG